MSVLYLQVSILKKEKDIVKMRVIIGLYFNYISTFICPEY